MFELKLPAVLLLNSNLCCPFREYICCAKHKQPEQSSLFSEDDVDSISQVWGIFAAAMRMHVQQSTMITSDHIKNRSNQHVSDSVLMNSDE